MKRGFFLRLALDGMGKNRRLYLPYLLTCAGMVMIEYILTSLAHSPLMLTMKGGDIMRVILLLGTVVVTVFALLFLFYTNSFLIRRRNREFGLYNILGMNKGNISRILLWETLLSFLFALALGLFGGLLFGKLAELFLLHMAGMDVGYAFTVNPECILYTVLFFGAVFALLLLFSLARVRLSKPLDLLKSEAAGEKPPKARWLFAVLGILLLGAAYYLSVSIQAPLAALALFFVAVLLVILATYLLFIAGSVALCRLLQKNKRYYYQPAHFVSVSSMAFRMKRNGAGLASICVLATMVLVMLSSTSCLYFGGDSALRDRYPYEISVKVRYAEPEACTEQAREELCALAREAAEGRESDLVSYTLLETSGLFFDGVLDINGTARDIDVYTSGFLLEHVREVYVLPLSDYNRMTGENVSLEAGEALLWHGKKAYKWDTFTIDGCRSLRIREQLGDIPFATGKTAIITQTFQPLILFVSDWADYASEVDAYAKSLDSGLISAPASQYCGFNLPGLGEEEQVAVLDKYQESLEESVSGWEYVSAESRAAERSDFFSLYGSLFFLGIILSIVFIAAAALIIYYKQLSEGYEDQSRFDIMQKVGMTKGEIRSAVNSQVLTVFFAPLLLAGVHLAFAFPFVNKIIRLFGVTNLPLLIGTNLLCFLAFAVFYVFVYRGTARAYYAIVSGGELKR